MARDRAEQLRMMREAFTHALATGLTIEAARGDLARARWAATDARLAQLRCGTRAPDPEEPRPEEADQGRELQWWQK